MKLGKEEIQKIVLGVLLLIGLVYSYFDMLLGPLKRSQEASRKSIAELRTKLGEARGKVRKAQQMEAEAPAASLTLKQIDSLIPEGSPVAWFPTRIGDHFKKQGVEKVSTRMNTESPEKDLPGYRRMAWGVELPKVEFGPFAQALAALENEEPLVEVGALQLETAGDDPQLQRAVLNLRNLVKQ